MIIGIVVYLTGVALAVGVLIATIRQSKRDARLDVLLTCVAVIAAELHRQRGMQPEETPNAAAVDCTTKGAR